MSKYLFALAVALIGGSPQAQTPESAGRAIGSDCGSVVIVKCEKRNQVESPNAAAERTKSVDGAGRVERRRSGNTQDLGTVVIEGDRLPPLSVEESLQRAMANEARRPGTHTFSTGEGTQCSCMNVCPPWWTLMPCCSCSTHEGSRFGTAPGSSPLR